MKFQLIYSLFVIYSICNNCVLFITGAVIVFTGLLSVAFLDRHLKIYEWTGIFIVILGLGCVGVSDIINPDSSENFSTNSLITGIVF